MALPVEIELSPLGPVVRHWDPEAKILDLTPQFYRGERYSIVAALKVIIKGKECGEYVLRMNGKTGALSLVDRTATVDPPIVKLAKEPISAPKSETVPGKPDPDPK